MAEGAVTAKSSAATSDAAPAPHAAGMRDLEDPVEVVRGYAERWRAHNKSGGLDDVIEALSVVGLCD